MIAVGKVSTQDSGASVFSWGYRVFEPSGDRGDMDNPDGFKKSKPSDHALGSVREHRVYADQMVFTGILLQ